MGRWHNLPSCYLDYTRQHLSAESLAMMNRSSDLSKCNVIKDLDRCTRAQWTEIVFLFDVDDDDDCVLVEMFEDYVRKHKGIYPEYRFWYNEFHPLSEVYIVASHDDRSHFAEEL